MSSKGRFEMGEIEVTQSNTGTYTVSFECPDGEELSKTNARLLFEESAISEVIDDLNMHRGDHALLARIAELEAERDRLREALQIIASGHFSGTVELVNTEEMKTVWKSNVGLPMTVSEARDIARKALEGIGK